MLRIASLSLLVVLAPLSVLAASAQSGAWLLEKVAEQATAEASAVATADPRAARTWRGWALVYRKAAASPNVQAMSALETTAKLVAINQAALPSARAEGNAAKVNLFEKSVELWADLHQQLLRGDTLVVHFSKKAMLTPVTGVDGTPWSSPVTAPVTATAADCRAIAQRARFCESQVHQAEHENMMGLSGDQSTYILVRQQQCHRWEEAYVAHCQGR